MTPATLKAHLRDPRVPDWCHTLDADCPIDRWISYALKVLRDGGIETYASCQGGPGHAFHEPTIRFHGRPADGPTAVALALEYGLPVHDLRRFWTITNGEPVGPKWELTFWTPALRRLQREAERTGLIA